MDTILERNEDNYLVLSEEEFESLGFELYDEEEYVIEKASQWIVDSDIYRPSTSLSVQKQLIPGVYQVEQNRDYGIFCKRIKIDSDQLIKFTDSSITSLLAEISHFWTKKALYKEHRLLHKRGILLEGAPGNGKTSIISLLSSQIIKNGGIVFIISSFANLNIYVEFIKNSFRSIEPDRPIITVIEDIDKFQNSEVILDFLDGKTNIENHVVLATTNNTENLPSSFLRPSRIDLRIEIKNPNEQARREYFIFKKVPEEQIDNLVKISEDFSIADLKELYISIFLLDYTPEDALDKIKKPTVRKDYNRDVKRNPLGI